MTITYEDWNKRRDLLAAPLGDWLHYEIQRRNRMSLTPAKLALRSGMEDSAEYVSQQPRFWSGQRGGG